MLAAGAPELFVLLGYICLGLLLLVVLRGFHQKNKVEIRVIRKRLGLGQTGPEGKLDGKERK